MLALAAAATAVVSRGAHKIVRGYGSTSSFNGRAYLPAPNRNAEWDRPEAGTYSDAQLAALAKNAGYDVVGPPGRNSTITQAFADAARLRTASTGRSGGPVKTLVYFNVSFWFDSNFQRLQPYANGFQQSWFLNDSAGNPLTYYLLDGQRRTPFGHVMDLANPALRAWIVSTMSAWADQASIDGIALDSANPLIPSQGRADVGTGKPFDSLLCQESAASPTSSCDGLTQWNAGLRILMSQLQSTLSQSGKTLAYNGIAPSPLRGATRNLSLLAYADIATDENFCIQVRPGNGPPNFSPVEDDLRIMQNAATQNKKLFEIVNYRSDGYRKYGDYCLAKFLIGWQPGSSYFIFHQNYVDPLDGRYPQVPEQNLALGTPAGQAKQVGTDVYERSFKNGFVVFNYGSRSQEVTAPATGYRFAGGRAQELHQAGQKIHVAAHDGQFFLTRDYLTRR